MSEQRDLSQTHPEIVAELRSDLATWRYETLAPIPTKKEPGRVRESLRRVVPLDGEWRIVFDRTNEGRDQAWWQAGALDSQPTRTIQVPSCWEEIEQDFEGVAWYQRRFDTPVEWKGRAVRLQFDAANYFTEVWLNGQPVGDHEGGYTPFEFNVTDLVAYGRENLLTVRVVGPAIRSERVDLLLRDEAPHWRGGYVGGFWQSVRLVVSHPVFTRDVCVEPDMTQGRARVHVTLENITLHPAGFDLEVSVAPAEHHESLVVPLGGLQRRFELAIPNARPWSPDLADELGILLTGAPPIECMNQWPSLTPQPASSREPTRTRIVRFCSSLPRAPANHFMVSRTVHQTGGRKSPQEKPNRESG